MSASRLPLKHVLLAEDEPISRAFLQEMLEKLGFQCESTLDGRDALRLAIRRRFDLLVLDLQLPNRTGLQILHELRIDNRALSRDAPAVGLTADNSPSTLHRMRGGGFAAVALKPLEMETFKAAIVEAMGESAPDALQGPRDYDDEAALRVMGGRPELVRAMRRLMLGELPSQRDAIVTSVELGKLDDALATLHRLYSASGFCGAVTLREACVTLTDALKTEAPNDSAVANFRAACDRLMA